jgi:hypothetical protein
MPVEDSSAPAVVAMPKSVRAGRLYSVTRMLAGLMSRCRMPARCAVSTAAATWTPTRSASATENAWARERTCRFGREQYSMTRYGLPSSETPAW